MNYTNYIISVLLYCSSGRNYSMLPHTSLKLNTSQLLKPTFILFPKLHSFKCHYDVNSERIAIVWMNYLLLWKKKKKITTSVIKVQQTISLVLTGRVLMRFTVDEIGKIGNSRFRKHCIFLFQEISTDWTTTTSRIQLCKYLTIFN